MSVWDKESEIQQQQATQNLHSSSIPHRLSSNHIEMKWQEQNSLPYWINPQLRLSMLNRTNMVAMFPYSETRPIPADSSQNEDTGLLHDHGGSIQSNLSRFLTLFCFKVVV